MLRGGIGFFAPATATGFTLMRLSPHAGTSSVTPTCQRRYGGGTHGVIVHSLSRNGDRHAGTGI